MQPTASQSQIDQEQRGRSDRTSRWAIAEHWAARQNRDEHFVVDLGEPSCFACGYYDPKWDKYDSPEECWNRSKLERSHIIAHSIGGQDTPGNYLLLCPECHAAAPMSNEPEWMLQWAKVRERWAGRMIRSLTEEFYRMGGTVADAQRVVEAGSVDWQAVYGHLQLDSHPYNTDTGLCVANGALMALHVARKLVAQEAIFPALRAKPHIIPKWPTNQ